MLMPEPVVIMVKTPDGKQEEMTVDEFAKTREERGLVFVQILRGFDPTFNDIKTILNSFDIEIGKVLSDDNDYS